MKTTHKPTFSTRAILLSAIALVTLAASIFFSAPIAQAVAARIKANPVAAKLLSYAPAPLRATLGMQPISAKTANLLTAFTKTASPASGGTVTAGGLITYTVTVTNEDDFFDDTATLLTDAVPANTTFVSSSISQQPPLGPPWICATPVVGGTGAITCQPNDLQRTFVYGPAQTFQLQYTVLVNPTVAVGTIITGAAANYISATGDAGNPQNVNSNATTHTVVHSLDLQITKNDSPDALLAGNNITYTIVVKNNGPSQAAVGEVRVTDALPANTTNVSVAGTGAFAGCTAAALNGAGCLSSAIMAPGESATITYVVMVNANTPNGFINNTAAVATVGAQVSDPNLTNNSASTSTAVGPSADLSVTKSALTLAGGVFGAAVTAGGNVVGGFGGALVGSGEIEYTLTYRNSGLGDATNVHIRDVIPAGTLLVPTFLPIGVVVTPATGPGLTCQILPTLNEYQLDCTPNTANLVLPAGANGTIQFSVRVPENILDGAVIKNVATIHSEGIGATPATPDPNGGNNTSNETQNIVRTSADLSVTKTGPVSIVAGDNITYTLTVTNNGVSDAQNVLVKDTLPPNVSFVSLGAGSDPRFACLPDNGNAGIVNCTAATLIAAAVNAPPIIPPRIGSNVATIIIIGRVAANVANGGMLTNNASVSASTQDPVSANNAAVAVNTTVTTNANVTIVKTDNPDPVVAGTNLTYNITVTNAGPSNAVAANVVDTLPIGTMFVSVLGTGIFNAANACTNAALTVTCTPVGGIIPAGSSSNIRIVVKVNPNVPPNALPQLPDDPAGLLNSVTVNWQDSNGVVGPLVAQNATATQRTTVRHESDMTITKEAPDTVVAGSRMDYRLVVGNNGPSTVLGDATLGSIMVMDTLPLGTSLAAIPNNPFVSPGGPGGFTCTYDAPTRKVTCLNAAGAAGNFPPGATVEIIIKVDTASNLTEGQNLINCAQVTLRNTNPTPEVDPLGGGQHNDANAVTLAASGNNEACDSTVVRTLADLAISKSALPVVDPDGAGPLAPVALPIVGPNVPPGSVNAGGYIRYDIPFGNTGPSDAINTIITDQIAGNTAFVGALAAGGVFVPAAQPPAIPFTFTILAVDTVAPLGANINLTCTVWQAAGTQSIYCRPQGNGAIPAPGPYADGTLPAGYNGTLTFFVMVNESVTGGTIIANPANITSGLCPNAAAPVFPPSACASTADPNTANNTSLATQTLAIASSNLTVSKIVQSAVTSASNPNQTGPLGPATPPNGAALTGTAVLPGTYLTYRVTITNNGPSDVSNLRLTDLLPSGLETPPGRVLGAKYISVVPVGLPSGVTFTCAAPTGVNPSNNPQGNGGSLACTAPVLSANAPNNTAAIDITVFIDAATKANLVNTATIDATLNNFNRPVSGTTTLTTPVAATSDLALTKTHVNAAGVLNGPVTAGTDFEYQVTITNNGPSAAQMVNLVDTIPGFQSLLLRNQLGTLVPDITIVTTPDGNGASNFTCTPAADATTDPRATPSTITCTAAELPPNKKADGTVNPAGTVLFRIRMRQSSLTPQPAPATQNCVTATSMSTDPIPANNTNICDPVAIIFNSPLAGTKTDSPDPVIAGNLLTYTITASPEGSSAALNFTIEDVLPIGTVFISAVASPGATLTTPAVNANGTVKAIWNAAGGTDGTPLIVGNDGLTPVGTPRTLTIVVRVCPDFQQIRNFTDAQMCVPNLTNEALIYSDTPPNLVANPRRASQTTTVQAQADLSIVKTAPVSAVFSTTMGDSIVTYTLNFANAGPSNATTVVVTDVLPKGFVVSGTPTSTVAGTTFVITTTAGVTTVTANLGVLGAANQCSATPRPVSGTITIRAIVPIKHPIATVTNTSTISTTNCLPDPNLANNTSSAMTAITEPGVIGQSFPAASQVSDQKAGSILFYPFYTSDAANPNSQNTRISLTNVSSKEQVTVHLFAVDGSSCSVLDTFVCLTPNQTASLLVSDFDPGASGYLMALVVDSVTGLPRAFNCLIGDEYFKMATGYQANVGAEAVSALMPFPAGTDTSATQATLAFDGMSYNMLPRQLAISNFPSPNDGNATLFILNRISGNYITTGDAIGGIAGQVFDDSEIGLSFTANLPSCQYRKVLDSTFPRTFNPFPRFISSGRSGWMKFAGAADIALFGLTVNLHDNPRGVNGGFSQGRNMHKLTLTDKARIIVPIYLPTC